MKKMLAFLWFLLPLTAIAAENDYGNSPNIGVFGELQVGNAISDIDLSFDTEANTTYDLTTSVTGDGDVSLVSRTLTASSTSGTARVESKHTTRYRAGHTGYVRFTASFVGAGTGYAGGFDSTTGFFIKKVGTSTSFCYRNVSGDTCEAFYPVVEGFNTSTIDWTKLNIFEIEYAYLGVADSSLYIYASERGRTLLHRIHTQGRLTDTHISSPRFPVAVETSGAMTVKTASWNAGTFGPIVETGVGRPFHYASSGAVLSGTNKSTLANFRNMTTFNSLPNKKSARLISFEFFVDAPATGDGTVEFKIYRNATLSGTPSYTEVSAGNSIVEYDTTATYLSDGFGSLTKWVGYVGANKAGSASATIVDAAKMGLFAHHGDTFTVTAQNVAGNTGVTVRVAFNWEEF